MFVKDYLPFIVLLVGLLPGFFSFIVMVGQFICFMTAAGQEGQQAHGTDREQSAHGQTMKHCVMYHILIQKHGSE